MLEPSHSNQTGLGCGCPAGLTVISQAMRLVAQAAGRALAERRRGVDRDCHPGHATGVRVTILSGGVGGARFTLGVLAAEPAAAVTVIANVGDDLEHWDLHVSPDVDTVLYTLSGRVGELGWGVRDDTRGAMGVVAELGGADWFILGDRDVGLHLVRTARLRAGRAAVGDRRRRRGAAGRAGDRHPRHRRPAAHRDGDRPRARCRSRTGWCAAGPSRASRAIRFDGAGAAPAPGVLAAIAGADRVLLAPSNPFISLDPILAVAGVRDAVTAPPRRRRRGVADHRRPGRQGAARRAARLARPRAQRARRGPLPGAAGGHVRAGPGRRGAGAAHRGAGHARRSSPTR